MSKSSATSVGVVFFLLLIGAVALRAGAFMLLIGILHAETGLPPHTIGFWICVPIVLLINLISLTVTNPRD